MLMPTYYAFENNQVLLVLLRRANDAFRILNKSIFVCQHIPDAGIRKFTNKYWFHSKHLDEERHFPGFYHKSVLGGRLAAAPAVGARERIPC